MTSSRPSFSICITFLLSIGFFSGCTSAYKKSVGADRELVISRVYVSDFNNAWQSVLEALKSYRLDVSDRDGGVVQTRWNKNTAEKNFTDATGGVLPYTLAQVRYRISLMRGFTRGLPAVKVSIQKEQVVQRDALDELNPQESDGVEEKTLMYRVGRILQIKLALLRAEEERTKKEMKDSEFNSDEGGSSLSDPVLPMDGPASPSSSPSDSSFEPASESNVPAP